MEPKGARGRGKKQIRGGVLWMEPKGARGRCSLSMKEAVTGGKNKLRVEGPTAGSIERRHQQRERQSLRSFSMRETAAGRNKKIRGEYPTVGRIQRRRKQWRGETKTNREAKVRQQDASNDVTDPQNDSHYARFR